MWTGTFAWADGDCRENATALLTVEKHLGGIFDDLTSLSIKRELEWVDVETFVFKYRSLTSRSRRQFSFVVEDDYPFEKMVVQGQGGKEIINFDHVNSSAFSPRAIDVSAQETRLGEIRWKPLPYDNFNGKMFELCSAQKRRTIGKIHVAQSNVQVIPLLDPQSNKIGQIFHSRKKNDNTFLLKFPETWQNSEKALFLAAALTVDMDCYFIEVP